MEIEREILYVKDVAKLLGVSSSALHQLLRRPNAANSIPKPFSIGQKKFCWRREEIFSWLDSLGKEEKAEA